MKIPRFSSYKYNIVYLSTGTTMENQTQSPLAKYLRQPKLYVSLPSQGNWYAKNNLDTPTDLEVYSMTANDELALKTPDGLYSGKVVTKVIQNCIPGIKDAWMIPMVDFDYILATIRLSSYGDTIQIDSTCSECKNQDSYSIDVQSILSHLENVQFQTEIRVDDFLFRIRPLYYKESTELSIINSYVQRALIQTIPKMTEDKEKQDTIDALYEQINEATSTAITSCVVEIVTPDGDTETHPHVIKEFILNSDPKYYNAVEGLYKKNSKELRLPESEVECSGCNHKYKIATQLDYSNFFG